MRRYGVDAVLDVGANDGPFAAGLRDAGYRGRIVSFEPQSAAYARLAERAASDPLWEVRNVAVGATDGEAVLHIAANSSSSSLLEMAAQHLTSAPQSRHVADETVAVTRLDTLTDDLFRPAERGYLKVDVQGGELDVLRGAGSLLERLCAVEAELSLVPLYEGAPLFPDVVDHLESRGFFLLWLEPVFSDPVTGRLLQMDGVFGRAPQGRSVP
jgi:FkbM family methyltransferase